MRQRAHNEKMKPTLRFAEHQYAETILRHRFESAFNELLEVLENVDIPLNPTGPYATGRPKVPKRHRVSSKGQQYLLKPISQRDWNSALDSALRHLHWTSQPLANTGASATPTKQKGDFAKDGIFVEVEFGNIASAHRDMLKFLIAHDNGTARIGVLVCMVQRMTRLADSNLAAFETLERTILPFLRLTPMPILFVGLDYRDTDEVILRNHYDEMYGVATANGVKCLTSEDVFGDPKFLGSDDSEDSEDDADAEE
jgi:hypothetical protein